MLMLLAISGTRAQSDAGADTAEPRMWVPPLHWGCRIGGWDDTSRVHVSVSTGMSAMSGFGRQQNLQWIAPSFELRPTDRLSVVGGFAVAGNLIPGGYRLRPYEPDLAPRRHGTEMTAMWMGAGYRVNDRLAVWGAVAHAAGFLQPLWLDASLPMQLTAVSGGLEYELAEDSFLELHFNLVHDRYGTLAAAMPFYPWYNPFVPGPASAIGYWPW